MRKYGKWALVLGLMAATPGLGFAAPWSRTENGDKASSPAPTGKTQGKANNQQVADDIAVALRNAKLQGYDIGIEYKNGVATLTGRVSDPAQKTKATQVVSKLKGVDRVDNQMVLTPKPSASERLGGQPAGGIQQAAHTAGGPKADRVKQVNFEPAVPSPTEAVTPAAGNANQAMAEEIAAALTAANLDGYDIEIRYQNGVAMLGGSVPTMQQRVTAERVVQQIPGVQGVQNQLRTTQEPQRQAMPAQYAGHPGQMGPQGPQGGPMMGPGPQGPMMGPGPQGQMMGPQGPVHPAAYQGAMGPGPVQPTGGYAHGGYGHGGPMYNGPSLPDYAWPSYAQYPNSAAVTYPQQYSASAYPYIGPFYPYPQVPLDWRDATLRWDDGQWNLQFRQRTDKWWWFLSPKNW